MKQSTSSSSSDLKVAGVNMEKENFWAIHQSSCPESQFWFQMKKQDLWLQKMLLLIQHYNNLFLNNNNNDNFNELCFFIIEPI